MCARGAGLVFGGVAEDFFEGGNAREDFAPAVHAEGVHAVGDGVFLVRGRLLGVVDAVVGAIFGFVEGGRAFREMGGGFDEGPDGRGRGGAQVVGAFDHELHVGVVDGQRHVLGGCGILPRGGGG